MVFLELVGSLGAELRPTRTTACDAGDRILPVAEEVDVHFACSGKNNKCKKTKLKRCLIFKCMQDSVIIPYDLSLQLGIIKMMCFGMGGAKTRQM